jgi:hypothetical protein
MRSCTKCEENPVAHFDSRTCWTCYHIAQVVRDRRDPSIVAKPKAKPEPTAQPDLPFGSPF